MKLILRDLFYEINQKMEQLRAMQETQSQTDNLTEREMQILNAISQRGKMSVSEITYAIPNASISTISTIITTLWCRKQMVSKTKNPLNQRTTIVELTDTGKKAVEVYETRVAKFLEKRLQLEDKNTSFPL